jgi:hypothetical protein
MNDHMSAHDFFVNAQGELITKQKPANIIVQEYRQLELSL